MDGETEYVDIIGEHYNGKRKKIIIGIIAIVVVVIIIIMIFFLISKSPKGDTSKPEDIQKQPINNENPSNEKLPIAENKLGQNVKSTNDETIKVPANDGTNKNITSDEKANGSAIVENIGNAIEPTTEDGTDTGLVIENGTIVDSDLVTMPSEIVISSDDSSIIDEPVVVEEIELAPVLITKEVGETEFAPVVVTKDENGTKKEVDVLESAAVLTMEDDVPVVSKLDVENICKFTIHNETRNSMVMDAYTVDTSGTKLERYNVINLSPHKRGSYENSSIVNGKPVPTFVGQSVTIYEKFGRYPEYSGILNYEYSKIIIQDDPKNGAFKVKIKDSKR